jgi:hypothetical protein
MSERKAIRSAGELLPLLRKHSLSPNLIKRLFAKLKSTLRETELPTVDAFAQ